MVSHHVHIWASDKYFTPTAASLSFSSSLRFIIFALHMCQCDSPSVLVLVHLFPLHLSLSRSLSLWSEASECFNMFWILTQSSMQQHTGTRVCLCMCQCVCVCVHTQWHIFHCFSSLFRKVDPNIKKMTVRLKTDSLRSLTSLFFTF